MSCKRNLSFADQIKLLASRQLDERYASKVRTQLLVTESSINRLGLERELPGHNGCVNCLDWNDSGTLLLSASDDVHFTLWDTLLYKKICFLNTGHRGNIFSVKFMPFTSDNLIATGAADCKIFIHDISHGLTTSTCSCHNNRVKRIATAPSVPYLFWSAGEDGRIMEFDLRVPHTCSKQLNNLLINLCSHFGQSAEAKCLAINPSRPEQLAVGCNDPYIRLYDRRMIRPITINFPNEFNARSIFERCQYIQSHSKNNLADGCAQYFVAGHLRNKSWDSKKKYRPLSTTYLTFSPSGTELLVNVGGEQIYLFDINNKRKFKSYDLPQSKNLATNLNSNCDFIWPKEIPKSASQAIENHVENGKNLCETEHFTSAIREYNKAVNICINYSEFYVYRAKIYENRAAAFIKRGWDGDIYAALRDCYATLELNPHNNKAYFRLAKCLFELTRITEASECLADFQAKFPDQAHSMACKGLASDIEKARRNYIIVEPASDSDEEENPSTSKRSRAQLAAPISDQEQRWRNAACDYELRFCGHCNTTTDIKEANFFGSDGQFIVAGSDDGSFFIWDRYTTDIKKVIKGDDSIVNCLQPHPTACILATSGIDPVVRIWSPLPEDRETDERVVADQDDVASANQQRMNSDPFEQFLTHMNQPLSGYERFQEEWTSTNVACRPS